MNRTEICGLGLMCGTSRDGLDIALVNFLTEHGQWNFELIKGQTLPLPTQLASRLNNALTMHSSAFAELDVAIGKYLADSVNTFISAEKASIDFVASHGVTIFHQPEIQLTTQLGSGAVLSALTGLPVVCDFRSQDVAKGGMGAPLVPYADKHLFNDHSHTINLGGFANVANLSGEELIGYDTSPCNLALNHFAQQEGHLFDRDGSLARGGKINPELLEALNALPYYQDPAPKSLGVEWMEKTFMPVLNNWQLPTSEMLCTLVEHISIQISHSVQGGSSVLVTGGGAHNGYLIERLRANTSATIVTPASEIIEFKEAIDFAFLGALRMMHRRNVSSSSTGAISDSIAGAVYLP